LPKYMFNARRFYNLKNHNHWHYYNIIYIQGCKWDNMSHTCLLFDYFCDCFLKNILKIVLEYSWKKFQIFFKKYLNFFHIILLRFILKIWRKLSFSKNSNPFTNPFITLKQALQCLMGDFVSFSHIELISN
jgi:hypothetical protein